ncbi:alpha/beta fold hydrolase [Actinoplanes sp. NPDC051346]|uniref:thioesterase II family protein n=1 Tax=Actinoplanes sp. NPDC051346 TaxID=3155048 RepID=UPI003422F04F
MNRTATLRPPRAQGWIAGTRPRRTPPAVRLFCLPWAGGSSAAYSSWTTAFPDEVEVCPIELPGRQTRWHQSPIERVDPLVNALATALSGELGGRWALFGHSMGALVAFELVRTLRRRGEGEPETLFVSAGAAPQLPRALPAIHDQPDSIVREKLVELGGVPAEVSDNPELMELLMPVIRADFSVCETYGYRPEPPLRCPIVAFSGERDREVPPARMAPWAEQTTGGFRRHMLPGGHFAVESERETVLSVIRSHLTGS